MDCLAIKQEFTSSSVICRLCLVQNSTYYEVFGKHSHPEIAEILKSLLEISISPFDNWPKNICTLCTDKIYDFRTLLTQSKQNEARLTKVFGEYQFLEEKSFDVSLQGRGSPEFISTDLKDDVKIEIMDNPIKDEDTDIAENFSYTSDQDVKEDLLHSQLEVPQKRKTRVATENKFCKKIVKKQRTPRIPAIKTQVKEKRPKDLKRDAEIHTFFNMDCVLCDGMRFLRFEELQKHFRSTHKSRGYIMCCEKKLNSPMRMQLHMQDHKNPVKYQCQICFKYFKRENILKTHLKLKHTPIEEREFACDKCPQRFALVSALKRHMVHHTAPEDRKHVCQTCGLAFVTLRILMEHVRRKHENAKNFVCEICAKVYRTKCLFEKHMAEHNNHQLKPTIPCPICGKMFKHRGAMRKHKRCHDTSGNLQCDYCPMVSVNRRALYEHVRRSHTKPQTCQCSICDRVFKTQRSLKEHMASHTGEVLYTCPYCAKEFNNNGNYFQHRKNSHPVEFLAEQEKRRSGQVYENPNLRNK